ncbi:MAG: hypothetical protein IT379_22625 [Deltaproteobacteria bacterium]|nr:hypothetical protein [Deltaproteobacteria bacterium]
MGDQERAGGAAVTAEMSAPQAPSVTAEMSAPQAPSVTAEMSAPPAPSVTAEMAPIAPSAPPAEARAPAPADPLGSTWATSRPISGPQVGHDEWSDGGGAPDLTRPRPRPPEPAPSRFPVAAVVGVVILGAAVGIGAMWAMKVGPFAPAPPPPSSPTPEPPPDRPPEAPPPTEPSTPPLGAPTTPTDPTAPAASEDAGIETSDAGAAAPAPTPPTPAPANPPDPQPATETGDDTRGLRDAQDALGRGDVAGARQILARLSARERSSPHGEALQSQVSERAGDLDGAITHARRAASMRPGRSSYRTRLGDLLLRAGAAGAARSEYEAALRTNPRDQNARRALERMGVHPPSGGGTATPPSGGTDSPPPSGGTDSPPPSGGTDSPPPSGGTDSPPSGGTDSPPPPPPPSGGTDSPPPAPPPEPPPAPPAEPAPGGSGAAPTPP